MTQTLYLVVQPTGWKHFNRCVKNLMCYTQLIIGERAKRARHCQGKQMEIGYIYMVHARHFSSAGPVVRNVGGVKYQPFLKCSNYC